MRIAHVSTSTIDSRRSRTRESQFPATARSARASGRQPSIARSTSSGVPNVVMSAADDEDVGPPVAVTVTLDSPL